MSAIGSPVLRTLIFGMPTPIIGSTTTATIMPRITERTHLPSQADAAVRPLHLLAAPTSVQPCYVTVGAIHVEQATTSAFTLSYGQAKTSIFIASVRTAVGVINLDKHRQQTETNQETTFLIHEPVTGATIRMRAAVAITMLPMASR